MSYSQAFLTALFKKHISLSSLSKDLFNIEEKNTSWSTHLLLGMCQIQGFGFGTLMTRMKLIV